MVVGDSAVDANLDAAPQCWGLSRPESCDPTQFPARHWRVLNLFETHPIAVGRGQALFLAGSGAERRWLAFGWLVGDGRENEPVPGGDGGGVGNMGLG
jgi:hypothetical protein